MMTASKPTFYTKISRDGRTRTDKVLLPTDFLTTIVFTTANIITYGMGIRGLDFTFTLQN